MSFSSLLNKTATIYRKVQGSVNEFGETSFTLSSVETIDCAIQPSREELTFHRGGHDYIATNVVYCEFNVNISPGDYLEVDGVKYLVLSVMDDAGREHHKKCFVYRT